MTRQFFRTLAVLPIFLGCTTVSNLKRFPTSNADLIASCGFANRSDLLVEAASILERFSSFEVSALGKQDSDLLILAETYPHRKLQKKLASTLARISRNKSLNLPVANSLLGLKYISLPECNDLPCAIPNSFSISIPSEWVEQLNEKTNGEEFKITTLFVLGHEFGHHVYSAIFRKDSSYPRVSQIGPLTPLKYHLTVDALGAILTGLSLDDAVSSLQITTGNGKFEGDAPSRLSCLRELK